MNQIGIIAFSGVAFVDQTNVDFFTSLNTMKYLNEYWNIPPPSTSVLNDNKNRCSSEPSLIVSSKPKSLQRRIVTEIKTFKTVKKALRGICSLIGDRTMTILAGTMNTVWIIAGVIAIIFWSDYPIVYCCSLMLLGSINFFRSQHSSVR